MPAAAVTPAPIAYIKVVAVKKLVVGYLVRWPDPPPTRECVCRRLPYHLSRVYAGSFGAWRLSLDLLL